ncbi:adenylate/guanylate cyclase domain-containing protein [Gordonia hydrophobica]|uniref:Adenylate/guanylate cyclase domain-containing protein n=1 Tax=Gordonia hydrophobica TaxID=40516 RepID=A0ABZ2U1P4_9ACTN|nr:adenylate/guanylate cyclase domain-containing protein [Gordonia hydrophobica]MBM7366683.1 adenylate cyclase [Gordonia hydrophobica]
MTDDDDTDELPTREISAELSRGLEDLLLGQAPTLTRSDVIEQSGVDDAVAVALWHLLGFPNVADDAVAFTPMDVEALRQSDELIRLGVVSAESQAALVRTLARSFARLAEWQTRLLAEIRVRNDATDAEHLALVAAALPNIEAFQNYVWRRHLASAAASLMTSEASAAEGDRTAIGFVDIVGYTSQSKKLDQRELIDWIESFEAAVTGVVVDHGGQVIKTIGDEALFVTAEARDAAEIALLLTARGQDPDDDFPAVRAGIAYGNVVPRLGDVFGPTVNIASRLTSVARPGTVVADRGVHDLLCRDHAPEGVRADDLTLRRIPHVSVKGYGKFDCWVVRRAKS